MQEGWKFDFKATHWKTIAMIIFIAMVLIVGLFAIKHFKEGENDVFFEILSEDKIPEQIKQILPRYKDLERALACKAGDEIFIIATRGEKPTGGYMIQIDEIKMEREEDKNKVIVYTTFKDPKPGDIVTQVVTYPYTVAKTDLKELPDKIELKINYEDE